MPGEPNWRCTVDGCSPYDELCWYEPNECYDSNGFDIDGAIEVDEPVIQVDGDAFN